MNAPSPSCGSTIISEAKICCPHSGPDDEDDDDDVGSSASRAPQSLGKGGGWKACYEVGTSYGLQCVLCAYMDVGMTVLFCEDTAGDWTNKAASVGLRRA